MIGSGGVIQNHNDCDRHEILFDVYGQSFGVNVVGYRQTRNPNRPVLLGTWFDAVIIGLLLVIWESHQSCWSFRIRSDRAGAHEVAILGPRTLRHAKNKHHAQAE